MLSLIEVTCPHCAAQGQIVLPPLGSIIIGPCPECQEMVVVFCGRVLALDSEVMNNGSTEQKRSHVDAVLGDFLHKRVERLFSDIEEDQSREEPGFSPRPSGDNHEHPTDREGIRSTESSPEDATISSAELESFVNVDLRLLDNADYFRAIFEPE